jgi:hypothetical protein
MTLSTFLRGMPKNSSCLHFRAVFMSYCPQFWGFGLIYKVHDTQYTFERHDKKLIIFAFSVRFVSYCLLSWGPWRFTRNMIVCTFWRGITKN